MVQSCYVSKTFGKKANTNTHVDYRIVAFQQALSKGEFQALCFLEFCIIFRFHSYLDDSAECAASHFFTEGTRTKSANTKPLAATVSANHLSATGVARFRRFGPYRLVPSPASLMYPPKFPSISVEAGRSFFHPQFQPSKQASRIPTSHSTVRTATLLRALVI